MLSFTHSDKEIIDTEYNFILSSLKFSFIDMGINNPLVCYRMLHKLLLAGRFSVDSTVNFDVDFNYLRISNLDYLGAQVMYGVCCCRHVSLFVNDVLNELGFNASLLYVNVDDSSTWKVSKTIDANHVVVFLKSLEGDYILDPFNNQILKKEDNQDLTPLYFDSVNIENYKGEESIQESVEKIGKTLKKYYTLRDLGVQFIYDYDL